MAITYVNGNELDVSNGGLSLNSGGYSPSYTLSFTMPTIQAGDDVYLVVYSVNTVGAGGTPPSGSGAAWSNITYTTAGDWNGTGGLNPYTVQIDHKTCDGSESGTTVSQFLAGPPDFTGGGSGPPAYVLTDPILGAPFQAHWVIVRGTDHTAHVDVTQSYDDPGIQEVLPWVAHADGDAFLAHYWIGSYSALTYPPEATSTHIDNPSAPGNNYNAGWYRIGSQTASVPGTYTGYRVGGEEPSGSPWPMTGITLKTPAPPGVGASSGTSTVSGVGASTARSAGASVGTSTATAHSGPEGLSHGTSTTAAVGTGINGSVGMIQGIGGAAAFTGLRQATGLAEGTSDVRFAIPLAQSRRTTIDHSQGALDRLCEFAKEAAHP